MMHVANPKACRWVDRTDHILTASLSPGSPHPLVGHQPSKPAYLLESNVLIRPIVVQFSAKHIMTTSILSPPAFLDHRATLRISSQAPKIIKSLRPSALPLPYPLSLLINSESPEKWQTYENLIVACLKTGDDKSAFECVEALIARFGEDNERVQALEGLYREAVAKNDAELQTILEDYEAIIKEDEANMRIRKRRVALLRSMGKTQEAFRALVKIVDVSPVDAEAWAEMAELNLTQGLYDKAVYCWEEVLLIVPNAWNVHARVAEVEWMWSAAIDDNNEKMRLVSSSLRRYCRSIELCDDYLRGYYGLKLVRIFYSYLLDEPSANSCLDVI